MKTRGIDMKKLTFGINTNVFAVNYTQFSHKYDTHLPHNPIV